MATLLSAGRVDSSALAQAYQAVWQVVVAAGFAHEIAWQDSLRFEDVTESDFLRENAWVVLCCGMREAIVRERFPAISESFLDWESADAIGEEQERCRCQALVCFNSPAKIDAIITTAAMVADEGFGRVKELVWGDPLSALQSLPFIGPVTSFHLAKNLGIPVAKPDRHLVRLAASVGYSNVQEFCQDISVIVGDPVPVVDTVLWRYATIEPAYVETFASTLAV